MKIVVTGAAGMLGSVLVRALAPAHEMTAVVNRTPLPPGAAPARTVAWDLAGEPPSELQTPADAWVHCAAYTSVDGAEADPAAARRVNVEGTAAVARAAERGGARLVYVSTDSVFDGDRGLYAEDDPTGPVNVYARTKLEGEAAALALPGSLVVRTNLVSAGGGLVEWVLRTAGEGRVVPLFHDVVFNPLPVGAVAPAVLELLDARAEGTVHLGSREVLSKAQFGRLVLAHAGLGDAPVREGALADAGLAARRPLDTSLCTLHARRLGLRMPSLDALFATLRPASEHGR